ncbi:MAG: hypothetical protein F4X64_10070 [Chloroflexi bacterium]|nr:hypothetical protein [Chloroflexota bacterium]
MNDDDDATLEVDHDPEIAPNSVLSEVVLLDLPGALVEVRGRVPSPRRLRGELPHLDPRLQFTAGLLAGAAAAPP